MLTYLDKIKLITCLFVFLHIGKCFVSTGLSPFAPKVVNHYQPWSMAWNYSFAWIKHTGIEVPSWKLKGGSTSASISSQLQLDNFILPSVLSTYFPMLLLPNPLVTTLTWKQISSLHYLKLIYQGILPLKLFFTRHLSRTEVHRFAINPKDITQIPKANNSLAGSLTVKIIYVTLW